mgnify:CR=1 FL=1
MRYRESMKPFAGVTVGIAFGSLLWLAVFAWFGVGR